MLKSRDCFKDMKEKRTYSYLLKCCNHLSEDLNIKIFWVGGMPLCPPRMVCLRILAGSHINFSIHTCLTLYCNLLHPKTNVHTFSILFSYISQSRHKENLFNNQELL